MEAFDFAVKKNGWVVRAHELTAHPENNTEYVVWKKKSSLNQVVDSILSK